MKLRKMTITVIADPDGQGKVWATHYSVVYNGKLFDDSKVLHQMLCQIDPGDTYTITFENETDLGLQNNYIAGEFEYAEWTEEV